jgi:hypothetical protein
MCTEGRYSSYAPPECDAKLPRFGGTSCLLLQGKRRVHNYRTVRHRNHESGTLNKRIGHCSLTLVLLTLMHLLFVASGVVVSLSRCLVE